jgi:hypothetical protein
VATIPGSTAFAVMPRPTFSAVHVDVASPLLRAHTVRRGHGVGDRRVGDADVDVVELREWPVGDVEAKVAAGLAIGGDHVDTVGEQARRDRRPDSLRSSRDEREPRHSSVSWLPARPASDLS